MSLNFSTAQEYIVANEIDNSMKILAKNAGLIKDGEEYCVPIHLATIPNEEWGEENIEQYGNGKATRQVAFRDGKKEIDIQYFKINPDKSLAKAIKIECKIAKFIDKTEAEDVQTKLFQKLIFNDEIWGNKKILESCYNNIKNFNIDEAQKTQNNLVKKIPEKNIENMVASFFTNKTQGDCDYNVFCWEKNDENSKIPRATNPLKSSYISRKDYEEESIVCPPITKQFIKTVFAKYPDIFTKEEKKLIENILKADEKKLRGKIYFITDQIKHPRAVVFVPQKCLHKFAKGNYKDGSKICAADCVMAKDVIKYAELKNKEVENINELRKKAIKAL